MKFYICRHGQSTFNVQRKIQGHTNSSVLTDLGKEQALEIGKKLQDKNIDIILSSPLTRALETAEVSNQVLGKEIIIDDAFIEINVGDVEGMNKEEVHENFPEIYKQWRSNDPEFLDVCFPNGETKRQARERILNGLKKYTEMGYNNIAITAHGIALAQVLLGLGEPYKDIPNAAILALEYENNEFKYIDIL